MGADWYDAALFLGVVVISDARSFTELEEKTKGIIRALKKIPDAPNVIDFMTRVHSRMEGTSTDDHYDMITIGIGYILYSVNINKIAELTTKMRDFIASVDDARIMCHTEGSSIKHRDVQLIPCIPSACYLVERLEDDMRYERDDDDEDDE
jgi:hypothetical protein